MMLAHGFGCDQHMWRHVAPRFEDAFQVVLFDLAGAGDGLGIGRPHEILVRSEDAQAAREILNQGAA